VHGKKDMLIGRRFKQMNKGGGEENLSSYYKAQKQSSAVFFLCACPVLVV